jgi:hypothetical protein
MAVRVPDPHNLRAAAQNVAASAIIEVDRACLGCGYNLRGLREGINCPECGLPSALPKDLDDPLALMPRSVIAAFIIGCWSASICVLLTVALVVLMRLNIWPAWIMIAGHAAVSVLWVGATILITPAFALPQAIVRGFSITSRLRRSARWLQLGWVAFAGAALLSEAVPNPAAALSNFFYLVQVGGFLAGMAGIVVLSILLQRLAEWTRDEEAGTAFNWGMWGLPVMTPLLFVDWPVFTSNALLKFAVPLLWLCLACTFPYGLLSLSKSVTLSIVHSFEHEHRQERKAERDRKHQEKLARMLKS